MLRLDGAEAAEGEGSNVGRLGPDRQTSSAMGRVAVDGNAGGHGTGDAGHMRGDAGAAQVGPDCAVLVGPAAQFAFGATPETIGSQLRTRTWSTTRPFSFTSSPNHR